MKLLENSFSVTPIKSKVSLIDEKNMIIILKISNVKKLGKYPFYN